MGKMGNAQRTNITVTIKVLSKCNNAMLKNIKRSDIDQTM